MKLDIEQSKKYLQGMHRLWLCDEWEQPYNSEQCRGCDSHDDCLDIVLSSGSMSDIAQDLLDTIEALQQENEHLQSGKLLCSRCMEEWQKKIETLQHENEQLRAQVARMIEVLELICGYAKSGCMVYIKDIAKEALQDITVQDYHNPADVEALWKAREALEWAKRETCNHDAEIGKETGCIVCKALAEIDKVIGGGE